jgi:hypothetical protein
MVKNAIPHHNKQGWGGTQLLSALNCKHSANVVIRRLCSLISNPRWRSSAIRTNKPSWASYQDLIQAQHSKSALLLGKIPETNKTFHMLWANGLSIPNLRWECFRSSWSANFRLGGIPEFLFMECVQSERMRQTCWESMCEVNNVMKSLPMPIRTTHGRKLRSHIIIIKNVNPPNPDSTPNGTFCMWWLVRSRWSQVQNMILMCLESRLAVYTLDC